MDRRVNPCPSLSLWIVILLVAGTAMGQEVRVNSNSIFVDPETAHRRQEEHNNFFCMRPNDPGVDSAECIPQILDLQTSPYALKERPEGLSYDVYSAIGYGLATSMMVVGPRTDINGHRRVIIIDTLEDSGAGTHVAQDYLDLYNKKKYGRKHGRYKPVSKLPIDAILYTHNHIDHTGGVLGYLDNADKEACPAQNPDVRGLGGSYTARTNCIEIICQEKVVDAVVNTSTVAGRIIQARSYYMYGLLLKNSVSPQPPKNPLLVGEAITNGIGPYLSKGFAGFRLPSRTFAQEMDLTAAGVRMRVVYVPSETNDELSVFVPDALNGAHARVGESGLLFSAEVIQGPAFPNLYSLRGTSYRSPATWFKSVDKLRKFDSWCMVPSHGPPVCHRRNIQLLLRNFRDAVQFTHDQTVRFMNKGYRPDDLVGLISVPDELTQELTRRLVPWPNAKGSTLRGPVHPADYLIPFYGSVPQAVREIYSGYVGWFEADPVGLSPTPEDEAARRMVALAGGGQKVAQAAQKALTGGDYQWAAELATLALLANPANKEARQVKVNAFTELGRRATDPNWSDWFFTAANELLHVDLEDRRGCFNDFYAVGLVSAVIQSAVPLSDWVDSLSWQLRGKEAAAAGASSVLGFWFQPTRQDFGSEGYLVQLRHGIAEVIDWDDTKENFLKKATVAVQMSQTTLDGLILAQAAVEAASTFSPDGTGKEANFGRVIVAGLETGKVTLLKGNPKDLVDFFAYFEPLPTCNPRLTLPQD